jgi:hypothetical protein
LRSSRDGAQYERLHAIHHVVGLLVKRALVGRIRPNRMNKVVTIATTSDSIYTSAVSKETKEAPSKKQETGVIQPSAGRSSTTKG